MPELMQRAIDVYKATPAEFEDAKANGTPKMAVVNYCRREGFIHKGWFIYSVPGYYLKTKRVDRWTEPGGAE